MAFKMIWRKKMIEKNWFFFWISKMSEKRAKLKWQKSSLTTIPETIHLWLSLMDDNLDWGKTASIRIRWFKYRHPSFSLVVDWLWPNCFLDVFFSACWSGGGVFDHLFGYENFISSENTPGSKDHKICHVEIDGYKQT